MKPHKHAELIKAWADGTEIEYFDEYDGRWNIATTPSWQAGYRYRIKPEPKPDAEMYAKAQIGFIYQALPSMLPNLKLTFDGETGKLKSAEVL